MLKGYYKRKVSNILVLIEYCFIDNQGAMIVYWMAYFFIRVGFGFNATWVALGYPLGAAVGSFTTSPLVNLFPTYAPLTTSVLLFLVCLLYNMFWLFELQEENLAIFAVLTGLASMLWICPFTRLPQTDVLERVQSQKEKYLAVNSMRMGSEILSSGYTLLIGFIMELNPRNFLYYLAINSAIGFVLHVARVIVEKC